MTKNELSQLYYLKREIEREKTKYRELFEKSTKTTSTMTGIPHGGGLSDQTAIAAEMADIETLIEAKRKACVAEYNRLMRYICGIDDSMMRQIIELRYVDCLTWNEVADAIGGNNTEDSVRMAHNRYLRENKG